MRARPLMWITLAVVCLVGILAYLRLASRPVGPAPSASSAPAGSRFHQEPKTNSHTVAESTAPAFLAGRSETDKTSKPGPLAHRLSNTSKTAGQLLRDDNAILLENALIDTSRPLGFAIPEHLRALAKPGSYIIQAKGAVNDSFRAALVAAGATVISYIPNNAFLVRASSEAADQLKANPQTQAVLPYEPVYKLKGDLLRLGLTEQLLPTDSRLNVMAFDDGRGELVTELQQRGLTVLSETKSPFGPVFTIQPAEGQEWSSLAQLPSVEIIELAPVRKRANDLSRVRVGVATDTRTTTNHLNLTGTNVLVSLNDDGVSSDHPDLVGRVFLDAAGLNQDLSGHGTHVAGIIAGSGAQSLTVTNAKGSINPGTNFQYRGMAPGARLFVQSWADADQSLQEGAALTNALVSNNSWTYDANTYGIAASSYDAAVRDSLSGVTGSQPVLYVFAAGNDGNGNDAGLSGDPETILSPGTAKNVITVGAIELARDITNEVSKITGSTTNTTQPWKEMTSSGSQVAGFSSRGNVGIGVEGDYGRFKPDVVAPGTFVVSTRSLTWDERAYYNPTSHHVVSFENQIVPAEGVNNYAIFLPANAVGFRVAVTPNRASPDPFPPMRIYVRRDDIPDPLSSAEFFRTNVVSVPPDATLGGSVGQNWFYSIANSTTQEVSFNILTDVITTNDLGDYHVVLSNLNNSISGAAPHYYRYESGTSMSAAEASGTLALIQEFFEQRLQPRVTNSPALMKALLINGARSLGTLYDFQVLNTINYQGWGLIKLANSVPSSLTNYTSGLNTVSNSMFLFDQSPASALATGQSQTRTINVSEQAQGLPLRITLVWTDPPGNPIAGVKLVNDLDLVVTNLSNGEVYYGNDIPVNSTFTFPWETNSPAILDSVNNVENVYISPALGSNYSVTVFARRVNVNAVTAHTNNVVQDYALVISSGNGEVTNALHLASVQPIGFNHASLYPEVTPITNQFPANPTVGGGILFNQRVGANTPLLGTTNGITNQWHFYVITNTVSFSNAAFVTFLPPTLALPRGGIFSDPAAEATRVEADIDLYVSQDFNLTNLVPAAVAAADKSRLRGGTEFITYTNSAQNDVYYIGVKSEDYMAAEFAIFAGFSLLPYTEGDGFGNWIVNGFPLPSVIPDGSPANPGASVVLGISTQPAAIRRLIVTNSLFHENLGDLIGTLSHNQKFAVLNNHRGAPAGEYRFVYEDNDEEPGLRHPDGPGKLRDFVGDQAVGVWLLTMVDDSLSQTGYVSAVNGPVGPGFRMLIEPSDTDGGTTNTIRANSFFYEVVDVPVGGTNLQVCVDIVSPNPLPIEMYIRYEDFPTRLAYDHFKIINPPGDCLNITPSDFPPLRPGRYYIGLFNPNGVDQDVVLRATVTLDPFGVVPIFWSGTGGQPILDDALGNYTRFVTNNARIAQLEVGLRVDHPRVSDLAVTLVSPSGTRVLLVENRGGTSSAGFGSTLYVTNFVPVTASGSNQPNTTVIETGATVGDLTIDYNFLELPDQMTVYYQGVLLWDSGMISGSGRQTLTFGPGASTQVTIIMNQFGNTNATTQWSYTVSSSSSTHSYLTFTENTNLTTTPVKFALPPFVAPGTPPPVGISDFELPTTNGNYFGPATGAPDGWNVMWTDPVTVVSNPPPANTGEQSLVLRSGQILRSVPTTPLRSYRLSYAYRQVPNLDGIVSWWPGELSYIDVVGTNNGVAVGAVAFSSAEVGSGFLFDGINSIMRVTNTPSLRFTTAMSVEAWIRPRIHGAFHDIITQWGAVSGVEQRSFGLSLAPDGRPYFVISPDGGAGGTSASGTTIVPLLTWTHVVGTYDGSAIRIYVNGVLEGEVPYSAGIFPSFNDLAIGGEVTDQTVISPFDGMIDEATLYRRAITSAEVANLYAAGASGKFGMMFPPNAASVSTNYPFHRSPVGAQIYASGQVTNSFLGDSNWQTGGLIFRATSNNTLIGLSPVVTGNHYYEFVRTNISWQNARAVAATLSTNSQVISHLATITSAAENEFLRLTFGTNLVNEFAWIGGREPASNGVWRWDVGPEANLPISTGATPLPPFNYANWGSGEPNNSKPNEDYLMFNIGPTFGAITNGQWADAAPTNSPSDPVVGFLVEYEPIPPIQSGVMVDTFTLQEAPRPLYVLGEESLDILRGENAYGLWQLEIWDSRTGATNQVALLDWQLQFVFVTNTPAARGLRPCEPTFTSIPPGQIAYYTVDVPAVTQFATNFLFNATGPLSLYFNQTGPPGYGATNVGDVVFANNATTVTRVTSANPTPYGPPLLLPGQRYYLAVENTGATNVSYGLQVCFDLAVIPPSTRLTNTIPNCATNLTPLGIDYYRFTVSTNARRAQFEIYNVTGDMTLLVRRGLPPTFSVFDYFSANQSLSEELVTVFDYSSPVPLTPGDWYLGAANLNNGPVTYCIRATEWFEYGTNIVITNWAMSTNGFCITWTSLPGVKYYIEGIADLTTTNWVTASPTITAGGYSTTYCIPLPTPLNFFRVREGVAIDPFVAPPVITRIDEVLTGFLISWSGPANAQYNVQWTPTLNTPPPLVWTTFAIPPTVTSTTGLFQFLDDGSQTGGLGPMRFYRLILLP